MPRKVGLKMGKKEKKWWLAIFIIFLVGVPLVFGFMARQQSVYYPLSITQSPLYGGGDGDITVPDLPAWVFIMYAWYQQVNPIVSPYDYIVYTNNNNYYWAKYGVNNTIAFSGTNATTIIQNAINHGDSLFLKQGTYIVYGISLDNNTFIDNEQATIQLGDTSNNVFNGNNVSNVTIRNLVILGNKTVTNENNMLLQNGIYLYADSDETISNILFDNVFLKDFYQAGILIRSHGTAEQITIKNCEVSDTNIGIQISAQWNITSTWIRDLFIMGNRIYNYYDSGVWIRGQNNTIISQNIMESAIVSPWGWGVVVTAGCNIVISGNAITGIQGISVSEIGSNVTVSGNVVNAWKIGIDIDTTTDDFGTGTTRAWDTYFSCVGNKVSCSNTSGYLYNTSIIGIYVQNAYYGIIDSNTIEGFSFGVDINEKQIVVSNNHIKNGDRNYFSINSNFTVISNNIIENFTMYGIRFLGYNSTIEGNVIISIGTTCISLYNSNDTIISDNFCSGLYGIREDTATCDYNIIIGNNCRYTTSTGILVVGSNTIKEHNLE